MNIKDTLIHKWLAVPYVLHVTIRQASNVNASTPTILFIHGIGNSGEAWQEVTDKLPREYSVVAIDLLGFGKSPRPTWGRYDAKRQARAVLVTYLRFRLKGRVIIVGHSLGALVAVEIAKLYPLLVKSLILCSPPFYKVTKEKRLIPSSDSMLREIYRLAKKHPEQFVRIGALGVRLGLVNKRFNLTDQEAPIYMNALESSIINQTSLVDAEKLQVPTIILHGRLDPVVIGRNLHELALKNKNVSVRTINASHEIRTKTYIDAVRRVIEETVNNKSLAR